MKIPSKLDCAYFAGFFDGEGSIVINRPKGFKDKASRRPQQHRLVVAISNLDFAVLKTAKLLFGGNIWLHRSSRNVQNNLQSRRADAYRWTVAAKMAAVFLESIFPYLTVKRQEAKIALTFQRQLSKRHSGYNPLSESELHHRETFAIRLKNLRISRKKYT